MCVFLHDDALDELKSELGDFFDHLVKQSDILVKQSDILVKQLP